eukprot:NODE_21_length_3579_cov_18.022096_g17_i0.p1 GENE.NODE_21_length_3579_cov_18.022096_g17_i0~~NODE_21_length_3579_cov_18.022096_g17_i0.p1  ORF type:complete len:880 (+),score=317.26 NODE_21_length_3579_cov_18.022096_g17_i0:60-2699(+)
MPRSCCCVLSWRPLRRRRRDSSLVEKLEKERKGLLEKEKEKQAALNTVETTLNALEAELTSLQTQSSWSEKQRALRVAKQRMLAEIPHVYGTLSDLATLPPQKHKYRLAIVAAMGRFFDAMVVDSVATAAKCIEILKETRAGTMTFIPLDAGVSAFDAKAAKLGGSAKAAFELLSFDPSMSPAVLYAVGSAVLVDAEAEAKTIAWNASGKKAYTAITPDGNIYNTNGTFLCSGKADLQKKVTRWDEQSGEKKREELEAQRRTLRRDRDAFVESLPEISIALDNVSSRLRDAKSSTTQAATDRAVLARRAADCEKALATAKEEERKVLAQLSDVTAQIEKEDKIIEAVQARIRDAQRSAFAEFRKKHSLTVSEDRLSSLDELRSSAAKKFEASKKELTPQIDDHKAQIARLKGLIESCKSTQKTEGGRAEVELASAVDCKKVWEKAKARVEEFNAKMTVAEQAASECLAEAERLKKEKEDLVKKTDGALKKLSVAKSTAVALKSQLLKIRQARIDVIKKARLHRVPLLLFECSEGDEDTDDEEYEEAAPAGSKRDQRLKSKLLGMKHSEIFSAPALLLRGRAPAMEVDEAPDAKDMDPKGKKKAKTKKKKGDEGDAEGEGPTARFRIDFKSNRLDTSLAQVAAEGDPALFTKHCATLNAKIKSAANALQALDPDLKATSHHASLSAKVEAASALVDTTRAKEMELRIAVDRLEQARSNRFLDMFEAVSFRIESIYGQLSEIERGGHVHQGTAVITLDSHETPWTGGCHYLVTPPLKRSRNLHELSGGEKMVAALALVFAIHAVRPCPFIVLDEIDANLDVPRILKVVSFIRKLAPNVQFLVVSHNPSLFAQADSLFGVTPGDERSSEVFSLDLNQTCPLD